MCCGKQRQQWQASERAAAGAHLIAGASSGGARRRQTAVYFEYRGPTRLTAIGGSSGARYRFEESGAVVAVDPRDRRSLQGVPHLRQVTRPW